jgi:DNA-binding Xre family transcriptional regulator
MVIVRLRLAELMAAHKPPMKTAYQLAKASGERISMTNAYRLLDSGGRPDRIELDTLEALCDVFNVGPGELLEREPKKSRR